ncbi:alpha-galactosidase [Acidipropionibacterium virtanenii]|uniref:alpha-galactosidase n=1 Tax=Acidipropionibacterium virtanenii TaxID=2057246 RepID=A0A344UXY4_9ACTN|nr:alpha-galactosidase [Acidipropionibacterium virtanenii]AXE40132.1 Alpha-galactosidase [Acidipropionibacterium virtanenii]
MNLDPRLTPIVHLRAGGTSLVIDTTADLSSPDTGSQPVILHWGPDLGELPASGLEALRTASVAPAHGGELSVPPRLGVIPLASSGWMGRPGLSGHRADGSAWAPRLMCTGAQIEGSRISYRLRDAEAGLDVDLVLEVLPQGLVRLGAEITNTGQQPYHLDELSVALPLPLTATEILDFAGRWGLERVPQRRAVEVGCQLRESRHGRPGFDSPMALFCGEKGFDFGRGRVWGLHVGHSGNGRTWVERTSSGRQVIGGGELLLPGEVCLSTGESYRSPWVYGQCTEGLDDAARQLHRWERSLSAHPGAERPVSINVWEAVYFDHDLTTLLDLAGRAASIGVERFVLDDGWFKGRRDDRAGLGDWTVDPDVWPHGLHPLVDRVHELGMGFGLWVEPEMINVDSDLARAHPDWIMRARDELPAEWRHQQVLNLTVPAAWEYLRSSISRLVEEYGIGYLKWDHNRDLIEAGDAGGRAAVHRQTLACYRLMDALRAAHPGLEIESCASGGGRIDLEMLSHVQRVWPSDCIDPHERQSIMRWTSQIAAPEYLGSHIASPRSHTTGRVSDLSFRAGTALWGHLGFEWDLLQAGDDEMARLAEWVEFFKEHRGELFSGDVVRRDVADGSMWLHGVVAADRSSGLFQLATRERSPLSPRGMLRVPGLEPTRDYRLRAVLVGGGPEGLALPPWAQIPDGVVLPGSVLAEVGVHTPLLNPDQVLILEARAV